MDNIDRRNIVWSENPAYVPSLLMEYWNTKELCFAEDLVRYVMSIITGCKFSKRTFRAKFEIPIHSPFNEAVRNAVNCILCYKLCPKLNENTYPITPQLKRCDPVSEKFKRFAHKVYLTYLSKCFGIRIFLYFCVDICIMAVVFSNIGMERAPTLAVLFILHYLKVYRGCSRNFKTMDKLKQLAELYPAMAKETLDKRIDRLRLLLAYDLSPLKEMTVSVVSDSYPNSEDEAISVSYVTVNTENVPSSEVLVGDSGMRAEAAGGFAPTESATRYCKNPKIALIFPRPKEEVKQAGASSSSNQSANTESVARYEENPKSTRPRSSREEVVQAGAWLTSNPNADAESVARCLENLNLKSTLPRSSREEFVQAGTSCSSNPNAETESVARYMKNLNLESMLPRSSRKTICQAGASSSSNPNADTESGVKCMKNRKLQLTLPLSRVFQAGASSSASLSEVEEAAGATGYAADYWEFDFLKRRNFELSVGECKFYPMTEEKLLASILEEC